MRVTLDHLRRYAVARSLFKPTTLGKAIGKLGFVQADPIRAPARAQDLTLRHRVVDYAAGDLERRYPKLPIEEDFFVNYGFLPRAHQSLMHPRVPRTAWSAARKRKAQAVLEFIREQGPVHPRIVDAHFAHGKITNWFGGSSNATTHLLDDMHYRGMLRIARRDSGTRIYAVREPLAALPDAATASALFCLGIAVAPGFQTTWAGRHNIDPSRVARAVREMPELRSWAHVHQLSQGGGLLPGMRRRAVSPARRRLPCLSGHSPGRPHRGSVGIAGRDRICARDVAAARRVVPLTIGLSLGLLQPIKGAIIAMQWFGGMHGFARSRARRHGLATTRSNHTIASANP